MLIDQFQGTMVTAELHEDKLVLHRRMVGNKTTKEIYLPSITSIEINRPLLKTSYIQFYVSGAQSINRNGITDPIQFHRSVLYDENAIPFDAKGGYERAVNFVNKINHIRNHQTQPVCNSPSSISVADEISKFKRLMDEGVISEYEFLQQKERLLGKTVEKAVSSVNKEIGSKAYVQEERSIDKVPYTSAVESSNGTKQSDFDTDSSMLSEKQKTRKGMLIISLLLFAAAIFSIPDLKYGLEDLPALVIILVLGIMFLVLAKSPKQYPCIFGKNAGIKKSVFVIICLVVGFGGFAAVMANLPSEGMMDDEELSGDVNTESRSLSEYTVEVTDSPTPTEKALVAIEEATAETTEIAVETTVTYVPVEKGAKGSEVEELQTRLHQLGYLNGEIDGIYGQQTVNAVTEFQRRNSLSQTGKMTEADFCILYSEKVVEALTEENTTMADVKTWYSQQMNAIKQSLNDELNAVSGLKNATITSLSLRFGNNDGLYECHYTLSFTCNVNGSMCNGEARAFIEYLGKKPEWFHLEIWRESDWKTLLERYDDEYDQIIDDYYKNLEATYG